MTANERIAQELAALDAQLRELDAQRAQLAYNYAVVTGRRQQLLTSTTQGRLF